MGWPLSFPRSFRHTLSQRCQGKEGLGAFLALLPPRTLPLSSLIARNSRSQRPLSSSPVLPRIGLCALTHQDEERAFLSCSRALQDAQQAQQRLRFLGSARQETSQAPRGGGAPPHPTDRQQQAP